MAVNSTSEHFQDLCKTTKRSGASCLWETCLSNLTFFQSSLSCHELEIIFRKYARVPKNAASAPPASQPAVPQQTPSPDVNNAASASTDSSTPAPKEVVVEDDINALRFSKDNFTSFLFSSDNAAFSDEHGKVYHDMTHPLPDYFISSSHNTYLIGSQLVGSSTIEGYIRALLHSCRSVESMSSLFIVLEFY